MNEIKIGNVILGPWEEVDYRKDRQNEFKCCRKIINRGIYPEFGNQYSLVWVNYAQNKYFNEIGFFVSFYDELEWCQKVWQAHAPYSEINALINTPFSKIPNKSSLLSIVDNFLTEADKLIFFL